MKRLSKLLVALALVAAACSGTSSSESDDTVSSNDNAALDEGSNDQSTDDDDAAAADADTPTNDGSEDEPTANEEPDDEDAAEIVGNPDLDLEELAEVDPDTAEALDNINDFVSVGDCVSDLIGLAMTYVPDGWQCRVLDQPVAGLDGFTLFEPGSNGGIEITIGTPSPLGAPYEVLQLCGSAQPIDLGSNSTMNVVDVGVPLIYGTHNGSGAEATVVAFAPLSDDDVVFVTMVLDGVQQF